MHVGPTGLLSALRQRFWLLGSRSAVRKITRRCVRCFRAKPRGVTQYMGNLPSSRVTCEAPFEVTGVDYAGPFLVKQGTRKPVIVKAYISVFVCLTTKALHLELVSDMSTVAFIAALQRFVSRRGVPREMHSDNGSNFRGAKAELHSLFFCCFVIRSLSRILVLFVNRRRLHGTLYRLRPRSLGVSGRRQ